MHLADLLIHLPDRLSPLQRQVLESDLRALEGVVAPRFSHATSHLLLVAYDPDAVDSQQLIARVRRHGLRASGAGL